MVQLKSVADLRKNIILAMLQANNPGDEATNRTLSVLTRHLRVFGKFFRRLQQLSLERFVALPMSGDLIMFYWSQVVDSTNHPQNLTSGQHSTIRKLLAYS